MANQSPKKIATIQTPANTAEVIQLIPAINQTAAQERNLLKPETIKIPILHPQVELNDPIQVSRGHQVILILETIRFKIMKETPTRCKEVTTPKTVQIVDLEAGEPQVHGGILQHLP